MHIHVSIHKADHKTFWIAAYRPACIDKIIILFLDNSAELKTIFQPRLPPQP